MTEKTRSFDLRSEFRVGAQVALLERMMRIELSRLFEPMGLTYSQFTALMAIYHCGVISNANLARISMIAPQSTNEMVKLMESRGWIRRQQDPHHKRVKLISMTAAGEEVLQQADNAAQEVEQRMLAGQSDVECAQLQQGLQACIGALGEPPSEPLA